MRIGLWPIVVYGSVCALALAANFALLAAAMTINAALVWLLVGAVRRWRRA
jgi:hypothetical protein